VWAGTVQSVRGLAKGWTVRGSNPGGGVQTGPGAHTAKNTMATESPPGVKRPGRGVEHPPPSKAKVKEGVELYTSVAFVMSVPILQVQTRNPLSDLK